MDVIAENYDAIIRAATTVAASIVGSTQAEDIAQEVVIKLWLMERNGRLYDNLYMKLAEKMAKNLALSRCSVETRRREIEAEHSEEIAAAHTGEAAFSNSDPLRLLEAEEMFDRFEELSPLLRFTMELYYIQGNSVEWIANYYVVHPNVIYKRLERARNIIKNEGDTNE